MNQHHALLVYDKEPFSCDLARILGTTPDRVHEFQKCTVADVRTVVASAWLRPEGEDREQLIAVKTEFIVEEAQQALLKIVEEPPVGTRFVFVLPEGYTILSTLQSRFQIVEQTEVEVGGTAQFASFIEADYKDRMAQIEVAIKQKDQLWQKAIKDGLRFYLMSRKTNLNGVTLDQLQYVLQTLLSRGASNKFLLEQLALVLPVRSTR